MTKYTGTITGSGNFSAGVGGINATVSYTSTETVNANISFSGNSFSASYASNSTVTVTATATGIAPIIQTSTFSNSGVSFSGQFPIASFTSETGYGPITTTWSFSPDKLQVSYTSSGNFGGVESGVSVGGRIVASGVLYADETANRKIYNWLESNWNTILTALQSIDPEAVSLAIANFTSGGSVGQFVSQLGAHITPTFSSTVSRLGGTLVNLQIGLLDPDVAKGVEALYKGYKTGHGLINENEAKQLQQIMNEMDAQFKAPALPDSQQGGRSNFKTDVKAGEATTFDPLLGAGYIYEAGPGGLKFSSVILPQIIGTKNSYDIYVYSSGNWKILNNSRALEEIVFASPVDKFLVKGEMASGLPPGTQWVSALSFNKTGTFDGSITTLNSSEISALNLPSNWTVKTADIAVCAATYQFFVGRIPLREGFEYLISSPSNENDLNDAYYAKFNQENRFINFSNNLASSGEGASKFASVYGPLSFEQTIRKAFEDIIGSQSIIKNGGNPDDSIKFFTNARPFYEAVAMERVVPAGVELTQATKIVAIGSILNEAIKAGLGLYAGEVQTLVTDLKLTGVSPELGGSIFAI